MVVAAARTEDQKCFSIHEESTVQYLIVVSSSDDGEILNGKSSGAPNKKNKIV